MPNSVKSGLKRIGKKKTKDWFSTYENVKKDSGDKSKAAAIAWSQVNKENKLSLLSVLEAVEKKEKTCHICGSIAINDLKSKEPTCAAHAKDKK